MRSIWSCRLSRNNTASSLVTPFISMSFTWFKCIFHCTLTIRTTLASFPTQETVPLHENLKSHFLLCFLRMPRKNTAPANQQRWLVALRALHICIQDVSRYPNWITTSLKFQCLSSVPLIRCHNSTLRYT